jgi:hypothetical protein
VFFIDGPSGAPYIITTNEQQNKRKEINKIRTAALNILRGARLCLYIGSSLRPILADIIIAAERSEAATYS